MTDSLQNRNCLFFIII